MPIDKPEAVPTTRRTFLTRAAFAGALVTVGTAAGPLTRLLPAAGAQDGSTPDLENDAFAEFAVPLEMAAVQSYQNALSSARLDPDWTVLALRFQGHHQAVVDLLTPLLPETTPPGPDPVPDPTILAGTAATVKSAPDQDTSLKALAELENVLAATHLWAIGGLVDSTTAKAVAQVLAVESQQAVALGRATGASIESLTPAQITTTGARTPDGGGATPATTTTTAITTTTEAGN